MKTKWILWYVLALVVLGLVIGVIETTHAPIIEEPKSFHMPDVEFGPVTPRLPEAE